MRTIIISAFPGVGKTHYHKLYPDTTLDSDSSDFSWIYVDGLKVRNPNFIEDYMNHIKSNIGKYEIIFVSSHKEVRQALIDNCLFFVALLPALSNKEFFLKRYKDRGSDENFIKLISDNWFEWISDFYAVPHINWVRSTVDFEEEGITIESEVNMIKEWILGEK